KSKEDTILFSKMFQANKKFYEAKKILSKIDNIPEKQISEVLVDLSQFLSSQNINFSVLEGNLSDLAASKDLDSEILHKAILVMLVNMDLNQSLKKTLQSFRILESEKSNSIDLTNLFFAEKFSNEGDYFNSINIFFSILGNKSFSELSLIENFAALLILKNLGFNEELRELSQNILL
ncbi:MAG: hypothetical protein VX976_02545, partial [Pseudomonadota bacterium]|nr:hypothetical protein [Pseudomonadota bacterium]